MYVERQQQRIKHQRKWQIEDRDVAPCRVPNIPLREDSIDFRVLALGWYD